MAYFRCGGGGVPASVKTDMNAVLNKKFGTSTDYPPADWAPTVNLMGPLPEKTVSSSPVADFSDGADDVPTKSLVVTIPPTLSGVSSVTEKQTGRNLVALNVSPDHATVENGVTINTQTASTLNMTTTGVAYACERLFYALRKGTYTARFLATSSDSFAPKVALYKYPSGSVLTSSFASNEAKTFTLTEDTVVDIRLFASGNADTTIRTVEYTNFQLEVGSTAHAYEPYTAPTTYTASLGRTIYGGQADIVNGVGQETYAEIDMGDLTWTYDSTYSRFISSSLPDCIKIDTARTTPILCSAYQVISDGRPLSQVPDKSIYLSFHSSGSPLTDAFVHDSGYTDATAFKTAVTGQKIVYQLKDSAQTDFTFTGQEVPTRLGYNAFWSDEGDTEVTYRADIDLLLGGN